MLIRWCNAILLLILAQNCICVKICSDHSIANAYAGQFWWLQLAMAHIHRLLKNLNIFIYVKYGLFLFFHLLILLKGVRGAQVTGHYRILTPPVHSCIPPTNPSIHYLYCLSLEGREGAGADPSWHWTRGGVHPGQVTSQSQGQSIIGTN